MNEMDPKEGISLNDLRGSFEEGSIQRIVVDEIHNHDDLITDVKWYPSNKTDRDEAEVVMSKPKAHHHMMGEGKVASGFSTQIKSVTPCMSYAMLEILEERYKKHVRRGDGDAYLRKQVQAQVGSLAELMVMDILYGNRKNDPKGMNGLATMYHTIGNTLGGNLDFSTRTMDAFPSGLSKEGSTNTSNLRDIFAVTFGEDAVKPFYPKDAENIGLDFGDKMERVQKTDPKNGGIVWYLQREFNWEGGVHVVNPTKAGRLCNFPLDKMASQSGYAQELLAKLIRFTDLIKAGSGEKTILYMDPMLWTEIKILLASVKWNNAFKDEDVDTTHKKMLFGKEVRLNESQAFAQKLVA